MIPLGSPTTGWGCHGPIDEDDLDTDVGAIKHGYISVTPITLDMTNYAFLENLRTWDLKPERNGDGL